MLEKLNKPSILLVAGFAAGVYFGRRYDVTLSFKREVK